mgnify:CR=1 FL=1
MTLPAPAAGFTMVPAGLHALADDLGLLATELTDDADAARSASVVVAQALEGEEGRTAAAAATAWGSLLELVADRARTVADTLRAAVTAYRAEDVALAQHVGRTGRHPR